MELFETNLFDARFEGDATTDEGKIFAEYLSRHDAAADFSRINVFLSDGSIVKTVESADYLWFQLLSDIGGQIGIWIGVSVITLSEVFEMVFLIVKDALLSSWKRKKERDDNEAGNKGGHFDDMPRPINVDDVLGRK